MKNDSIINTRVIVNHKTKGMTNFITDCLLLINGLIIIISGLTIQFRYHGQRMDPLVVSQIADYIQWSQIHKISIITGTMLILIHIIFHLKWYKTVLKKGLMRKNKLTISLSIVFLLAAFTGFTAWIVVLTSNNITTDILMERRHFIEIHDKLGIILTILIILHLTKKTRWLIEKGKKFSYYD